MFGQLEVARKAVEEVVGSLEPALLHGSDAARLVEELAAIERVAAAGKALAAGRVADSGVWRTQGDRNPAQWLARVDRSSLGQAAAVLATAERLADLPATDAAFRAGSLSPGQAREIASAASVAPQVEETLLKRASIDGFRGLQEQCRKVVAAAPGEAARHDAVHSERRLRHWTEADGAFRLDVRTTADAGAAILAGLQPHTERIFREARDAGRRERLDAYAADALVAMARTSNGDGQSRPAAVHVVVDAAALRRGRMQPGERCQIPGVGPVPVATARALLSDAVVDVVITDGVDVANVTHLGRTVTAHQRSSLLIRDPECVVPGCHATEHLEIDHVTGWALTKTTCLADLARLCARHHQQKTTGGYRLQGPPGHWTWHPPDAAAAAAEPVDQRGRPPPQLTLSG